MRHTEQAAPSPWGVVALAAALRLLVVIQPIPVLLAVNVPDDAFYYFQIARSHAEGRGFAPAVTGPTTGFHPLWGSVLALYARWVDPETIPRVAVAAGAVVDLVTCLLLWRLASATLGPRRAWLALALYGLSPLAVLQATSGVETAVNVLSWTLLLAVHVGLRSSARGGGAAGRHWVALALAAALALMARTDNVFLVLAVGIEVLWSTPRHLWLRRLVPGLAAGLIALLPWLWWCYSVEGTLLQTSAQAKPFVLRNHPIGQSMEGVAGLALAARLFAMLLAALPEGPLLLACLVLGMVLVVRGLTDVPADPGEEARVGAGASGWGPAAAHVGRSLLVFLGAYLAMLTFHALVRLYVQHWYLGPTNLLFAWLAAAALPAPSRPASRHWLVGLVTLVALVSTPPVSHRSPGGLEDQTNLSDAARHVRARLAGRLVGAFNSGILGFVAPEQGVNLDGVVNGEALAALKARDLLGYVRRRGIDYVLDNGTDITDIYRRLWGVDAIERHLDVELTFIHPAGGINARLLLCKVRPAPR